MAAMNRSGPSAARSRPRSRSWRRTQRGAAIFVVILVLTILTAIGVFAARAAGLNQRASGYARQSTQTGYITEYGMTTVIDTLFGPFGGPYKDLVASGTDHCHAVEGMDAGAGTLPCKRVSASEMQKQLTASGTSAVLFSPDSVSQQPDAGVTPDFVVELTDLYRERPIPGYDQGGTGPAMKFFQVTLTGSGQVRPIAPDQDPEGGLCVTPEEKASAQLSGTRTYRAVVAIGAF